MKNKIYIFDFDSTLVQVETIEILAEISLAHHPEREKRMEIIHQITEQAMIGRYSYQESLRERFSLLNLTSAHLSKALDYLQQKITPSVARNSDFFKKNADFLYVISGSFIELVWPIVQQLGFRRENVFANRLLYDFEGNIVGYDEENPLAQDQGKVKLIHQLKLKGDLAIIGDGYTDFEIKESGLANTFVAFTENVSRESVLPHADVVIKDLEGLFLIFQIPSTANLSHPKILLLENIHPHVATYFKNQGFVVETCSMALEQAHLLEKMEGVSVLGIRSKTSVTKEIIEKSSSLLAIGAFCIGSNQINLQYASQKGIAVFNAPFSNTRSVVELTIGMIILLMRRAIFANQKINQGMWEKSSHGAHEVRGKTLGIIGYGNIGSQLSVIAESLGMRVLYYDIVDKLPLGNAKACPHLDMLLHSSDVVTVHIDGRKENTHFINQNEFDKMKPGVIFLNLSRGFVINYVALEEALKKGKIGGIGIDVFPEEPEDPDSKFKTPLQSYDNVFLTPHIGGSTEEAQQNIGEYVSKNLFAYLSDGSTLGSVNFPQLNLPSMDKLQRIIHIHENVPGILAQINSLFAQHESNIEGQFLKTNLDIGYVITDLNHEIDNVILTKLESIPHTIKVRILNK